MVNFCNRENRADVKVRGVQQVSVCVLPFSPSLASRFSSNTRISNAKAKHQHFLSFELGRIELSPIPVLLFLETIDRSSPRFPSDLFPSSRFPSLLFLPRSVDFDNSSQLSLLFSLWPRFRETKNHPRICYVHLINASQPREDRICAA